MRPLQRLALQAVTVAAGVVDDLWLRSDLASQLMPAEGGAATALDGQHDFSWPRLFRCSCGTRALSASSLLLLHKRHQ